VRSLSADLQTAQASSERTPLSRVTIRDLRLQFDTVFDCSLGSAAEGDLTWANSIRGASCEDASGYIHRCIAKGNGRLYHQKITDLTDWDWAKAQALTFYAESGCRCGIAESSGTVRIFYQPDGTNSISYRQKNGGWGIAYSLGWAGGTIESVGLTAVDLNTIYAYVKVSGVAGHRLYRCHYDGSWAWETGPHIFTGKGRGALYSATFISAVTFNSVDYIIVMDHDDGRAVMVKYHNGVWSDPVSVLPIDVVSNPADTSMPSSVFIPYSLSVVNDQLFLCARYVRPGSDAYDFDCECLLRGDGEHWTLDRHHALWRYSDNLYVGMRAYVVGSYIYLVACQKVARATATNLVGVDAASKKTTITSDIHQWDYSSPGANAAATLNLQIANADGSYDEDPNIRQGAELTLEAGWDDGKVSDYVQLSVFGVDSVLSGESYGEDTLGIVARSAAMKKLLDWRAAQAYDYFSQCKIFEPFDDFGGFTEWITGWDISETGELQLIKLGAPAVAEVAIDSTDWTTLGGVLAKTKFKFGGLGNREAGILLNCTDKDYKSVVLASNISNSIKLYNMRDGVWEFVGQSGTISWSLDTWYDLAVVYAAGLFRVFYKSASATQWTEVGGTFPYRWDRPYPAIEAEIYGTDSEEDQAKGNVGDRYAADEGYVGLRAYVGVLATMLTQDLWNPDKGDDELVETVVVGTVIDFPDTGELKIDDEIIIYSSVHTGDEQTVLVGEQKASGENDFEVVDPTDFPGHGVILVENEAIEYAGYNGLVHDPGFHVAERGAGGSEAVLHPDGTRVYLDGGGVVRNCTSYFNVPFLSGTADADSTVEYLKDADEDWSAYDLAHCRLELTQVASDSGNAFPMHEGTADGYDCDATKSQIHDEDTYFADDEMNGLYVILRQDDWYRKDKRRMVDDTGHHTLYLTWSWGTDCPAQAHGYELWGYGKIFTAPSSHGWTTDEYNGYMLKITGGEGMGFTSEILDTVPASGNKTNYLVLEKSVSADITKDTAFEIWPKEVAEDEVYEIESYSDYKIYPTEDFSQAPGATTAYTVRGRGAYSTTPTSHSKDTPVYWYVEAPVQFDFMEVYSLGKDFSVDWLLKDVCYRAGVTSFRDTTQASGSGTLEVAANSYRDLAVPLVTSTRTHFQIEVDVTIPDDPYAGGGLVFRSATEITAGQFSLPRASQSAYELTIYNNGGNPFVALCNLAGGLSVLERVAIDFDITGQHVWRVNVWKEFCSVWCDDKFVWAFHDTTYENAGYVGLRLLNAGEEGALTYTYSYSSAIPELYEREPWFGYISGMTGQQAVQDLIRQRRLWWLERSDASLEFSRFYTRDDLGTYSDLHETSRNLDDRGIASVVLVTSEEYVFYVHPETLAAYGYRFLEVNNPDLNTEEELLDDAKIIQRMSREESEQRGYLTERARLETEPEDKFALGGTTYVVNDIGLSYGPARLSQRVGSRLFAEW